MYHMIWFIWLEILLYNEQTEQNKGYKEFDSKSIFTGNNYAVVGYHLVSLVKFISFHWFSHKNINEFRANLLQHWMPSDVFHTLMLFLIFFFFT